ncbi:MAG: glutamate--tRNA ligase [Candidatus Omnitrophica bacterium]|nr:glutamate--tRNA ligase [Candidatus Omnitrophota bacterium]MDD5080057.1 glutamate--tRNA ligase [Candidatus Omnitrophota bacterium]
MVRVRFAPSPTGNLHIGGARTALFNWLYACSQSGEMILRIEDTDTLRSKKEYIDEILGSLKWLGFNWGQVYYQSQRFDIYREYAQKLLSSGKAYIEKNEAGKEAIIYKVTGEKVKIKDLIHGEIEFDTAVIKDQVLIKSDGTPTYNFACVVDDALMEITHIIRGDDHISNTPKQLLIYEALGFNLPQFAHLPLILAKGGGRMSKRKGATAISEYRQAGYLPQAMVNFLMLLGWAPGENREIIDIKEAIKLFDIKHVNKTAAVMDMDKLDWINNQYLKNEDTAKLAEEVIPLLIEKGLIGKDNIDREYTREVLRLFQSRLTVLQDFVDRADSFFVNEVIFDQEAKEKFLSQDLSREFGLFTQRLSSLEKFEIPEIEECFRKAVAELGIQSKALIHPVRVALTGKTVGPGLFEVIYCLGKGRAVERLSKFIKK